MDALRPWLLGAALVAVALAGKARGVTVTVTKRLTHRVLPGETLEWLARHYGSTPAAIKEANGLTGEPVAGQVLSIPWL